MKTFLVAMLLCFSVALIGQESIGSINVKKEKCLTEIKTDRRCDIQDVKAILSYYVKCNNKKKIKKFLALIYENKPETLDFNFHQEIVDLSFEYYGYLGDENISAFDNYYRSLRFRFTKVKEQQQQILLAKAKLYLQKGELEDAYSRLSEIMRIRDATVRSRKEDKGLPHSNLSFEYGYRAYILFLQYLPVDDFRFKMFAKNIRYRHYLNHNNQYPYKIINEKLSKAGYEVLQIPQMRGGTLTILSEKERALKKKEDEIFKEKYEWKKKE